MGNKETTTKFSRLKSISRIEDYSFTLLTYLFSSVCLQLQRKLSSFIVKNMFIEFGFEEVSVLKTFFKFICFRLSLYIYEEKL